MPPVDLAINDGLVFDGSGGPGQAVSVGVRAGRVVELRPTPYPAGAAAEVIDARGRWVMPGFVDLHTHYDAEVEAAPALLESLRHGVTTVVVGSCSLGTALSAPVDIADMFTRVEAMPREHVLPLFERIKTWGTPAEYRAHLDQLPLGPNVAAFLGHSDLRVSVLGLDRAVERATRPSDAELARMDAILGEALDAGYLGLSANTNRWDKLGGARHRSKPLPSTFARWRELRHLCRPLRARGRVLQAIPNISAKYDLFLFLAESIGLGRPTLKTTLVSLVDIRSNRAIWRALSSLLRTVNRALRGDVRLQALPMPFELFVDGLDAPVFEELMAGTAALHIEDPAERARLLRDPRWRRWFHRQWTSVLAPKVFHRDLTVSTIVAAPDPALVGRSFAEVAAARGSDLVTTFLDLCAEHGDALRWFTVVGNDRPDTLRKIVGLPDVLIGFSDAGAHLRNMAFYNFGLHLLRLAHQGAPGLPVERAVHRLTGELADWLGLDAGHLAVGRRADLVVVDPRHLDGALDAHAEAPIAELGNVTRMVKRNDAAVPAVVVGGRIAVRAGVPAPELGVAGHGRFLAAGEAIAPRPAPALTSAGPSSVAGSS